MEDFIKNPKEQIKSEIEQFSTDRINFKLSLRKKKFNNLLTKKRIYPSQLNSSEWQYELFFSNLVIPENCKKDFSDNDELISSALIYMKSDDINTAKYGIYQIKTFISNFMDDNTLFFNLNFISDILNLLEKWGERKEKQLVFNILYIMVDYSYINSNKTINKILLSSKGYKIWDLCFDLQDYEIMSQLVWILNNIISGDKESTYNLLKSNFFQKKIFNFYSNPTIMNHLNENNEKNKFYIIIDRGITLLTNLLFAECKSCYEQEEIYRLTKPILELVLKYSKTNSSKIFLSCIYLINIAIEKEPRLIDLLDNSDILNDILNKKFFSHENSLFHCNKIIGQYICFKAGIPQDFYDKSLNYEIYIFFGMKSYLIKKEVFWILSNILHDNIKSGKNLSKNEEFINKIFDFYKNTFNLEDIGELCNLFLLLIRDNDICTFFEFINKGLLDITLEHIKNIYNEPKSLKNVLELIYLCLDIGQLGENELEKRNIIKERCEHFGLRELLTKYEDSEDEEICKVVEKIIKNFYY